MVKIELSKEEIITLNKLLKNVQVPVSDGYILGSLIKRINKEYKS